MRSARNHDARRITGRALIAALAIAIGGCVQEGDDGAPGAPGRPADPAPTRTLLDPAENLPGVNVTILGVSGQSGADGSFQVGDRLSVRFTVTKNDTLRTRLPLSELDAAEVVVAGPTSNYQRVLLASGTSILTSSVVNADGSNTYTFATPFPATYPPQLNVTSTAVPSVDPDGADWKGLPLVAGTYTVGLRFYKNYTVAAETVRDANSTTFDFLGGFGANPGTLAKREVVKIENCNACHVSLRAHGGSRRGDVTYCLLCHTAGAEDRNTSTVLGGTPGVTIDFKVMIHKLHNARHLPSVNGVATTADGARTYTATAKPYQIIGFNNSINDFSDVGFPMFPVASVSMPHKTDYVNGTANTQNTAIHRGVTDCDKCHGKPADGSGATTAPAQGSLAYSGTSKAACGSCHDDINWSFPYKANNKTMPILADSGTCLNCHQPEAGTPAPVPQPASLTATPTREAHRHPLADASFNPGFNFRGLTFVEAGTNNGNGKMDVGEKVSIKFRLQTNAGADAPLASMGSFRMVVTGPTGNLNRLLYENIGTTAPNNLVAFAAACTTATSAQGTVITVPTLPVRVFHGVLGQASGAAGDEFAVPGGLWRNNALGVVVNSATGVTGSIAPMARDALDLPNSIEVVKTVGFNIANNDYVRFHDTTGGAADEYRRVASVETLSTTVTRLWFDSALLVPRRAATTEVQEATVVAKTLTTDYTVDGAGSTITTVTGFPAGSDVLVTYYTDFVVPAVYPGLITTGPTSAEYDETWGAWRGKPVVAGTYQIGLISARSLGNYPGRNQAGQPSYNSPTPPAIVNVLLGSATTVEPHAIVSSGRNCNACHGDIAFHGYQRRGLEGCLLCHSNAGIQARGVGESVDFRTMLHKVHHGRELANASTYFAGDFAEIGFPDLRGGTKDCTKCHGNTAWQDPKDRDHPSAQGLPAREFRAVCTSCHDSAGVGAHVDLMTSASGEESCVTCHGAGNDLGIDIVHKVR
jgi:OmcA/MtrC family decaheme c-type cytochrome